MVELLAMMGRDPSDRPPRAPRGERPHPAQHTPQFLQRGAPVRAGAGADDFED
jgi:hypothetical protein